MGVEEAEPAMLKIIEGIDSDIDNGKEMETVMLRR